VSDGHWTPVDLTQRQWRAERERYVQGRAGDNWPELVAEILAVAGLLVSCHDAGREKERDDYIEALRVLLAAWHSPRDGEGGTAMGGHPRVQAGRLLFFREGAAE